MRISRVFLAFTLLVYAAAPSQMAQERTAHPIAVMGIPSEIAPVEARLSEASEKRVQAIVFSSGKIDGVPVVAARTDAGKVNAAIAATLLIDHFSPTAVVFSGTAGAVDPELNPGDVVIATAVGFHDFGNMTTGGFIRSTAFNTVSGLRDPAFFPADPALLAAARRAAASITLSSAHIREGLIVTGDAFVANPGNREELRRELKASAVEMEGAAVAQVCSRLGVPFIVIRSITDRADGSASGSYRQFVQTAAHNAADLVIATIREMGK